MVNAYLYVEGGGDYTTLKANCRKGFTKFLENAGVKGYLPPIVACGGRTQAYDMFCRKFKETEKDPSIKVFLLIDSEFPVSKDCEIGTEREWKPWQHLKEKENKTWIKPGDDSDEQCHLMVKCMEAWIL